MSLKCGPSVYNKARWSSKRDRSRLRSKFSMTRCEPPDSIFGIASNTLIGDGNGMDRALVVRLYRCDALSLLLRFPRAIAPERRTMALGITPCVGSSAELIGAHIRRRTA